MFKFLINSKENLVNRLIKTEVQIEKKKNKTLLREQWKRSVRKEAELKSQVDIERKHLKKLQAKLNEEIDRVRSQEELYSYKLLILNQLEGLMGNIVQEINKLIVVKNDLEEAITHLHQSSSKQEIVDKMFKSNNSLVHLKRR